MPRFTIAAFAALSLAASVTAQSASVTSSAAASVVSIFLLDEDPESLVASVVGSSNSLTTLAINCAPSVDSASCGYPTPITVTAGPSTIHASASVSGIIAEYGCDITSSLSTGQCSVTYIGAATDLATDEAQYSTATGTTTIVTSGALDATDITYYPITVTAGKALSGAVAASTTSGTSSSSSASGAAASSHSGSSSSVTSSSAKTSGTGIIASASSVLSSASHAASSGASSATSSAAVATHTGGASKVAGSAPGVLAVAVLGLAAFL